MKKNIDKFIDSLRENIL